MLERCSVGDGLHVGLDFLDERIGERLALRQAGKFALQVARQAAQALVALTGCHALDVLDRVRKLWDHGLQLVGRDLVVLALRELNHLADGLGGSERLVKVLEGVVVLRARRVALRKRVAVTFGGLRLLDLVRIGSRRRLRRLRCFCRLHGGARLHSDLAGVRYCRREDGLSRLDAGGVLCRRNARRSAVLLHKGIFCRGIDGRLGTWRVERGVDRRLSVGGRIALLIPLDRALHLSGQEFLLRRLRGCLALGGRLAGQFRRLCR